MRDIVGALSLVFRVTYLLRNTRFCAWSSISVPLHHD
jgi:hypothetical protein